jgi:hypothetical protein
MAWPISKNQIIKLGKRLAASDKPEQEDLDLLEAVRASYDPPLAKVEGILRYEFLLPVTSRIKTSDTIIDKLKREHTRLSTMQDIAGVRLVSDMTLSEQNMLVRAICGFFPGAKTVDRRRQPSYGYRAFHVIPEVDGFPVEIHAGACWWRAGGRMKFFLIVYDKSVGEVIKLREYGEAERAQALQDRFRHERANRSNPAIEVVLLGGESEQAVRKTHSRYFKTTYELAADL